MAAMEVTGTGQVLQVKITLQGVSKPPVWRRVLIPGDVRLDRFHEVVLLVMGWMGGHMHVFSSASGDYGFADPELGHRDERKAALARLLATPGDRIAYTYDFGDDWEHSIVLERLLAAEADATYPVCVAGRGACPPEDCGGVWGYQNLREVLADPRHEEHEEMLEWLGLDAGSDFDPHEFDVDAINEPLTHLTLLR